MIDTQQLWTDALEQIKNEVSPANFSTWFKNTHIEKHDSGTIYVGVPNEFVKEWLMTKYHKIILKYLRESSEYVRNVEYVIARKTDRSGRMAPQTRVPGLQSNSNELPLGNIYVNNRSNLNPRYIFDSFIVGPFNELAYSAAQAIVYKPGVYNPLYIYGETGLGKTHLIQAIGNTLQEQQPDLQIFYTNTEKFTMDLVSSLKSDRMPAFKEKYRKYDVFIMDDIQFLSGKDKTQEELFHLFNVLYDRNKQIIFSSDQHPNFIIGLESRLKSRFSAGMIVDVGRPEYESRVAIISSKVKEQDVTITDEVVDYIASHVEGNIRELEGIVNSVLCHVQLKGGELNISTVQNLIKNSVRPKKHVSVAEIVRIISNFYNLEPSLIYEKTRRKEIVRSRQIIMYILREDYSISFPHIGKELGGRDHTTVIHSCDKIKRNLGEDSQLHNEIEQLRSMLATR